MVTRPAGHGAERVEVAVALLVDQGSMTVADAGVYEGEVGADGALEDGALPTVVPHLLVLGLHEQGEGFVDRCGPVLLDG